jgi:predicted NBD/HSP70 family sugar kinase
MSPVRPDRSPRIAPTEPEPGRGTLESLRESNRSRVINALREHGAISRAEISRQTRLSRSTVSSVVRDLAATSIVVEVGAGGRANHTARGGRPGVPVALSESAGFALGIDVGHRMLRVAVCDLGHRIVAEQAEPLSGLGPQGTLEFAARLARSCLDHAKVPDDRVVGVAMSLSAPIDADTGTIGAPYLMPGWAEVPVGTEISHRLGLPVRVDNDANMCTLAEAFWGAGRGCDDLIYVKAGAGIGCGLMIAGRLHRGASGTAGEIGHTTVVQDGRLCKCGNRGCLETVASAEAITGLLGRRGGPEIGLPQAIEMAMNGDRGARRILEDAAAAIGVALANLCNILNPSRIVIGGELTQAEHLLFDPLRSAVRRSAIQAATDAVDLVPAQLGERAEVLGALALVLSDSHQFMLTASNRA